MSKINRLNYILENREYLPNSLSIFDSDYSRNGVVMRQLVGTLIRYSSSTRAEGYLAQSWNYDSESYSWNFNLRKGLKTDQGIEINAQNYISGFYAVFREFIKKSDPPVFKELLGYEDYKNGFKKYISGVSAINNNTVQFRFTRKVSGLLEFLSMPYYGFISLNNFKANKWGNNSKIDSSAGYLVDSWIDEKLVLKKKQHWILNNELSPNEIIIKSKKIDSVDVSDRPAIISISSKESLKKIEKFYKLSSTPSMLTSIVLSTTKNKLFKLDHVRRYLRKKIIEGNKLIDINAKGLQKTTTFYSSSYDHIDKFDSDIPIELKNSNLTLDIGTIAAKQSAATSHFIQILDKAFESSNIRLNWIYIDKTSPNWIEKYLSNNSYDIRITSVDTGDHPINWVIEMMFCSNLGISFPDYSGRVCNLVEMYKESKVSDKDYHTEIEKIIREDSVVIPIFHKSNLWHISNEISPNSLEPTSNSIYFDEIRIVN